MFHLSNSPISPETCRARLKDPGAGACVSFEGWVRDHNEGRQVERLEYEAYDTVALSEGCAIIEEALARFDCKQAYCVHRTGMLGIGDMAVWVGVSAAHRGDAFDACRYIIDEVKHRAPIWKKEYYTNGDSGWVACEHCHHAHDWKTSPTADKQAQPPDSDTLFARQIALPEVGGAGQRRLAETRVLIVGAGGLGCPAAQYLAAAGVGAIGVCEDDSIDASNLHRQPVYAWREEGQGKAERMAAYLQARAPWTDIVLHATRITAENVEELFVGYDICLDCTDNFETKFLLNDAAVAAGIPLVQASIYQYEGQLITVRGDQGGPCLRCLWPEAPTTSCVGNCAEVGVLGAVPGILGAMQAMEALKLLLKLPGCLENEILFFNLLTWQINKTSFQPRTGCICQQPRVAQWKRLAETLPLELDKREIEAMPRHCYQLIDIRSPLERELHAFTAPNVLAIPQEILAPENLHLNAHRTYILCCNHGLRSKSLVSGLRANGQKHVYSLRGGIVAWERENRRRKTAQHA